MLALPLLIAILLLAWLPGYWVKGVLARHSTERSDFPGTGAEFARHLLGGMKLGHVKVERTDKGDHYDPADKVVRLSEAHFAGRSLSAVVVAAHEVGHAMQDATGYAPLVARTRMAKSAENVQRLGSIVMLAAPVLMIITKTPVTFLLDVLAGAVILGSAVLMHAVTLPVEFDASFRRALPVLQKGGFIPKRDMPAARQILRAAALTYIAAAAMTLLDVTRWFRVFRF